MGGNDVELGVAGADWRTLNRLFLLAPHIRQDRRFPLSLDFSSLLPRPLLFFFFFSFFHLSLPPFISSSHRGVVHSHSLGLIVGFPFFSSSLPLDRTSTQPRSPPKVPVEESRCGYPRGSDSLPGLALFNPLSCPFKGCPSQMARLCRLRRPQPTGRPYHHAVPPTLVHICRIQRNDRTRR